MERIFDKENGVLAIAWLSSLIPTLKDKKYKIIIKEYRPKRSLDANAYCWVLIDRLADKTGLSKSDIYRNTIKEIGGVSEVVCVQEKAVDKIIEGWTSHGEGWQAETLKSKIDGCVNVILYYGSSVYDTKQMSRLIDCIVQDCKAQGIETMPPGELQLLKEGWGK